MATLTREEVQAMVDECVESAVLLTEGESSFVMGMSMSLAAGGQLTPELAQRVRQIYYALQGRAYG